MLTETSAGNSRSEQKRRTRELILAAARELFAAEGFAVTTRRVAEHCGVATGTVFAHFPDKTSLLAAVLYDDIEAVLARAFATIPRRAGAAGQLVHLGRRLFEYYAVQPALSKALLKEAAFLEGPWAQRFDEQIARFQAQVAGLLAAARERGELRPDADLGLAAASFFACYQFVLVAGLRNLPPDPKKQAAMLRRMTAQLLDGLRARP